MSDDTHEQVVAGRFRIGRALGSGGRGTVYEAVDVPLGRPVALKVLRPRLATDPQQLARFEREARAAARLAHPNVVGVTELVKDPAIGLALVMELLAGESLATRLERGPLSGPEAVNVIMQALDGLAAAHAAGMVHRDLKPSNLFLVPIASGVLVKVLDFGIVKLAEEGALPKLTRKGALIGTPTYMSPEQINCEPVDARSDVYSMGACLYEALIARPPYVGTNSLELIAAVGGGPPPDLRELNREVALDLAHIARVAMSRDPGGRYQSAEAMREALRSADASSAVDAHASTSGGARASESLITTLPSRRSALLLPVAALGILVASLAALGAWQWSRGSSPPPARASAGPSPAPPVAAPPAIAPPPSPAPERLPPALVDGGVAVPTGLDPPEPAPPPPFPPPRAPPLPPGPRAQPPALRPVPRPSAPTRRPRAPRIGEDVLDPFAG